MDIGLKNKVTEYFDNSKLQKETAIEKVKQNPHELISRIKMFMSYHHSFFMKYFFIDYDYENAIQELFTSCSIKNFLTKNSNYFPTNINSLFDYLNCNEVNVLRNFVEISSAEIEKYKIQVKNGSTLGFVVQQILKGDNTKALEYLKIFYDKHKKYDLKEKDGLILESIIKEDKEKITELINFYLKPEIRSKMPDKGMISHSLMSTEATVYAKLAWLKGIEVEIDHPLLPMELLPIKPNKEYIIEYDFLKPDYKSAIQTKKEVPRPNRTYRKDKPKNKIGVSKQLISNLLKENWDATYSQEEFDNYVNTIYSAFINPQEADSKYYDFAKLGNLHKAGSNNQIVFIESKPYTQMWTVLKNEIDYFIDLLNSSFDIIGAKLVDDEQYLNLKSQLEENANRKRGFLGKWLN